MNTQPEALRLADELEGLQLSASAFSLRSRAASELRKQHEEIQCEERRFNELWDEFYEAVKTNEELINALSEVENYLRHAANSPTWADKAKSAISKATGEVNNSLDNQPENAGSPITTPHSATHSADSAETFGKRKWIGLTDEEMRDIQMHAYSEFKKSVESVGAGKCSPADIYRLIESKLKEKNT